MWISKWGCDMLLGGCRLRPMDPVHQTQRWYDNMTSNSAKCFDALTVEPRLLPIIPLLEFIIEKL